MNLKGSEILISLNLHSMLRTKNPFFSTRFCHLSCEGPENTLKILLELWKVILFMPPRPPFFAC